jgi:diguanylate cyclase (GGDEF)-like protein/PAS domain S-box-containing protein
MAPQRTALVERPALQRWGLAVVFFGIAMAARALVLPYDAGLAFLSFYPAAGLAMFLLGTGPGWLVVALSCFAAYFVWVAPYWSLGWSSQGALAVAVYVGSAALLHWLVARYRSTMASLDAARSALQAREVQLAADTAFLQRLADNLPVRLAYCDTQARYRFVNLAHCHRFGLPREQILGRTRSELTDGASNAAVLPRIAAVLAGQAQRFEYDDAVGGAVRRIESVLVPDVAPDGSVLGFFTTGTDITERTAALRALAASEALLDRTGRVAGVGGWQLELPSNEVRWTAQTRAIHEVAPDWQPTLETAIEFYAPQVRPVIAMAVQAAIADGVPWDLELPLVTATGRPIWVRAVGEAEFQDGRAVRLVGAFQDITALQESRAQAQRLTAEQNAMLDNDLVAIVKLRDRVAVWKNKALERLFGYTHDELIGQPSRMLYLDDASFQTIGSAAYEVLSRGGRFRDQFQMRRKDGSAIWVDASGFMLAPHSGESMWMMTDITELKLHQARVEHLAFHDPLTGLPNRLLLGDRLQQAVVLNERQGRKMLVCYIDLDGFKAVNDVHGHDAGDLLLKETSRRLQACLRASDTVARLGGDEFVLLLTPLDGVAEGRAVVQRVIDAVALPVGLGAERQARVSASVGVALYPDDATAPTELLARADAAMYEAKREGKNRAHGFPAAAGSLHADASHAR